MYEFYVNKHSFEVREKDDKKFVYKTSDENGELVVGDFTAFNGMKAVKKDIDSKTWNLLLDLGFIVKSNKVSTKARKPKKRGKKDE